MSNALTNVSFDGSPVRFRMDSRLLAGFDPLALDLLHDLLPEGASFDLARLLERANANHPAIACLTVPDFQRGAYTLDPRDIKKFGDDLLAIRDEIDAVRNQRVSVFGHRNLRAT